MDLPAGVIPTTVVREDEQVFEDKWNDRYTEKMRNVMKNSKGLPVGV